MSLEREKRKSKWCTGALFDILKRLTRLTGIVDTFPEKVDVFSNAMKQDFKSKNPTTRWSDIIKLK